MTRPIYTLLTLTVLGAVLGIVPRAVCAADPSLLSHESLAPRQLTAGRGPAMHSVARLGATYDQAPSLAGHAGDQAIASPPADNVGLPRQAGRELLGDGSGIDPRTAGGAVASAPAAVAAQPAAAAAPAPQAAAVVAKTEVVAVPVQGVVTKSHNRCGHVISMLMRHCLGNRSINPCIKHRIHPAFLHGGFGAPIFPAHLPPGYRGPGDLELLEVRAVSDASPEQGPLYQVTFRNNSRVAVEDFCISLAAVLGRIQNDSPTTTVEIPQVAAGATATVQVQMPVTVMAIGPQGSAAVPFDTLVVVLDSLDELIENNELNNVLTLKRVDVQVLVSEEVVAEQPDAAAPAITGPATGAAPAEAIPAPAPQEGQAPPPQGEAAPPPQGNEGAAPNGDLNLDNLDLEDAEGTALFIEK